jgi:exopolyphosphatase/guanosine-5'-triphosphate,3'-diphosphate pyrophosphatase
MNTPFAIVDMGTSTFKLGVFLGIDKPIYSQIFEVRLGDMMAENGQNITAAAMRRGVDCMIEIKEILKKYGVEHCKAVGTSAMRTAQNGKLFAQKIHDQTGINAEIISGDTEALLIYKGVAAARVLPAQPTLVLDIGGGSVEFFIANDKKLYWHQSIEIGTTRLHHLFAHSSPMAHTHAAVVRAHIDTRLKAVFEACAAYNVAHICGASNSFDSISMMICNRYRKADFYEKNINFTYKKSEYNAIYNKIMAATDAQRLQMPEIPTVRQPVMALAMLLIDVVVKKLQPQKILATKYALKEGICIDFEAKIAGK